MGQKCAIQNHLILLCFITSAKFLKFLVPRPDGTMQQQVGTPIKVTDFEPAYKHIGTAQGTHAVAVLSEMGFTAEEIAGLIETGVVAVP